MIQPAHILVVDDDPVVRAVMAAAAAKAGYRVDQAEDAAGLRAWLAVGGIDLVLLDVTLPDGNGLSLAREIKERSDMGVIMVTEKGSPDDRALGIEIGADDYLPKPIYPRELLARIKNVVDRRGGGRGGGEVEFDGWRFHEGERRICDAGGRALDLTPAEFDLLSVLIRRAGRIQSREQLMDSLGSADAESGPRSIDILISRLRRKLGNDGVIETCRGHGYRFTATLTRV